MKCHYTNQVTRTAQVQETAPSTSKKNRKIWLQNMNEEQADSWSFRQIHLRFGDFFFLKK